MSSVGESSTRTKQSKQKSQIWEHFIKFFEENGMNNKATCNYCGCGNNKATCNYCGCGFRFSRRNGYCILWRHLENCSSLEISSSPYPTSHDSSTSQSMDKDNTGSPQVETINVDEVEEGDDGQDQMEVQEHVEAAAEGEAEVEVEDNPFKERKRKKTSHVWLEFNEITLPDGTMKAECIHCKQRLAMTVGGPTTHLGRHLKCCFQRRLNSKNQPAVAYEPTKKGDEANVVNFKYDHAKMRESVAQFVLLHEHPFNVVEQEGFNMMIRTATPFYKKISRATVKADCIAIYEREKKKLKTLLKNVDKISLTTDLWKSTGQEIHYMVLTGHFIDSQWRLQKRVLSFVDVPPPRGGVDIADAFYKCLTEWGIEEKVYTISVDNASYNDLAIRTLLDSFARSKKILLGGKLFHVRCCAHILNLLVQDGLSEIKSVIENVRESVKFVNQTDARLKKFAEIVQQLRLPARKLILDCLTRWNSTYEMLVAALKFKDAFPRFKERETQYTKLPSPEDWKKAENVCEILQTFYTATKIISGSEYPTSNLFLAEVYRVKEILNLKSMDEELYIRQMVKRMREKFDKYWGECNLLMAIGSVLDPRCKMRLVEFCFPIIYSEFEAQGNIEKVKNALYDLYREYEANFSLANVEGVQRSAHKSSSSCTSGSSTSTATCVELDVEDSSGWSKFDQFVKTVETIQPSKSDLDVYLEENVYRGEGSSIMFDALKWWKLNELKYRILSKMACDILAIPITTVASESTFSAGGRVIDPYRASLATDTVQVLICGGDWLRHLRGMKKPSSRENKVKEIVLPI